MHHPLSFASPVHSWAMWLQFRLRQGVWETPKPPIDHPSGRLKTTRQYCSLNRSWAEFSDRRIYSKISFPPSSFGVCQLWLPVHSPSVDELLDTYADPSDACPFDAETLVELQCLRVNLVRDVSRCRHSRGAGQLGEISEPYRDRDGAAQHVLLSHPSGCSISHPKKLATHGIGIIGVPPECLL